MSTSHLDIAQVRLDNALLLFDEFVQQAARMPMRRPCAASKDGSPSALQIQPSYWSQIKGRSRQIGERLARQFEQLCRKPYGWMDRAARRPRGGRARGGAAPAAGGRPTTAAADEDERFIVGLVLTYYRRHPERARTRLLELLGEALAARHRSRGRDRRRPQGRGSGPRRRTASRSAAETEAPDQGKRYRAPPGMRARTREG